MKYRSRRNSLLLAIIFLATLSGTAMAVPTLQLDIGGGVYNTALQDVVATTNPFTLYALLTPDSNSTILDSYILSIAVTPQVTSPANLGSFTITGPGTFTSPVEVTSGMTYGTPPIVAVDPGGDLAGHGVFPTYFLEVPFQFSTLKNAPTYNTQDNPGGPDLLNSGATYYQDWVINSSLDAGYFLHFDLYQLGTNPNNNKFGVVEFAPFSHDASTSLVPEAGALLLFGTGLIGLVGYRRMRRMQ